MISITKLGATMAPTTMNKYLSSKYFCKKVYTLATQVQTNLTPTYKIIAMVYQIHMMK